MQQWHLFLNKLFVCVDGIAGKDGGMLDDVLLQEIENQAFGLE